MWSFRIVHVKKCADVRSMLQDSHALCGGLMIDAMRHEEGSFSPLNNKVSSDESTPSRLRLSSCRSVGAILCALLILRQRRCWMKERCHCVTTHSSTDRCRANHDASLLTQIIKPTCGLVEHSSATSVRLVGCYKLRRLQCGSTPRVDQDRKRCDLS
ncbi:hypothetical protein PoB_003195300 [Plakobranchus ocellatus]|uniref:Uncharacterized protein n=1 Tax=Plakobranchus ocellatus TaxID=259542 RepID=A0AAV4AF96_9GAST|nr:hypothetical protein PoB_003195300 [Plakobranchus ocellatus]